MRVTRYIVSVQNGYGKSSCWPWQHPGESPTYILHKDKKYFEVEHARTIFCVKLSINNHIVGLVHKTLLFERVWRTTQLAKLSFNHSNRRTHSWRCSTFYTIGNEQTNRNGYISRSWVSSLKTIHSNLQTLRLVLMMAWVRRPWGLGIQAVFLDIVV